MFRRREKQTIVRPEAFDDAILEEVPPRYKAIAIRWVKGMTYEAIAKEVNRSPTRVMQICRRLIGMQKRWTEIKTMEHSPQRDRRIGKWYQAMHVSRMISQRLDARHRKQLREGA